MEAQLSCRRAAISSASNDVARSQIRDAGRRKIGDFGVEIDLGIPISASPSSRSILHAISQMFLLKQQVGESDGLPVSESAVEGVHACQRAEDSNLTVHLISMEDKHRTCECEGSNN